MAAKNLTFLSLAHELPYISSRYLIDNGAVKVLCIVSNSYRT